MSALLTAAAVLACLGCGAGSSGQENIPGTAESTAATSPEFQQFEKSHFGFFRAGGSYPYVSELNVHWQRPHPGPFVWGAIEKTPGAYDWSQVDRFVSESQDFNILTVATIWPFADWDQASCHEKLPGAPVGFMPSLGDYRGKPCDSGAYQRFVTALTERYDGDGVDDAPGLRIPIKYWEIVNEPEWNPGSNFFSSETGSDDYLEVLKISSQAIRTADPGARVLNGGIATLAGQGKPFWEAVLGGENSGLIDVLNIHAVPASEDLNLVSLYDLIAELGLNKPVWVTEIQFAQSRRSGADPGQTQDYWSTVLVKEYVEAFGRGADKLFYLGLDNATPTAESALLVNCATSIGGELEEDHLLLSDCQKQKPYYAFATMVDKLDYFDSARKLAEGQYRFTVGDRAVYVLWGSQPPPPEITGTVRMTDLYGSESMVDAGSIELTGYTGICRVCLGSQDLCLLGSELFFRQNALSLELSQPLKLSQGVVGATTGSCSRRWRLLGYILLRVLVGRDIFVGLTAIDCIGRGRGRSGDDRGAGHSS